MVFSTSQRGHCQTEQTITLYANTKLERLRIWAKKKKKANRQDCPRNVISAIPPDKEDLMNVIVQKKNATSTFHFSARFFFFLSSWDWGLPSQTSGKKSADLYFGNRINLPVAEGVSRAQWKLYEKYKFIHYSVTGLLSEMGTKHTGTIWSAVFRMSKACLGWRHCTVKEFLISKLTLAWACCSMLNQELSILMSPSVMYLKRVFLNPRNHLTEQNARHLLSLQNPEQIHHTKKKCTKITADYLR